MNIQSLSIVVPTKRCVNNCPFCVSKMHDNDYENSFTESQVRRRLQYSLNNGVNTVILTGTGEVLQNKTFLTSLKLLFESMGHPFPNIELQTTGVLLDQYTCLEGLCVPKSLHGSKIYNNINLIKDLGVSTVSLSVSNIFDDARNMEVIGVPAKSHFKLVELIDLLKKNDLNVRLSLNMIKDYDEYQPADIISRAKELGADQVTFRKLFNSGTNGAEDLWVRENSCRSGLIHAITNHIKDEGEFLYTLPYGPAAYSINGMSTVIDKDCMSKLNAESLKYLILRENGKLYCRWDDKGSLIF